MNLVAWKSDGLWRAFEDSCPHRCAPLSEGRIEDGCLLCSYHGWQFDGEGGCAKLPYSPAGLEERHKGHRKSRCRTFPTRVAHGLLFVFPGDPSQASETKLPLISEFEEARWDWKIPAGVRDFPCSWDAMVENTLDPAHFCAAHHGTLGNRYTDPRPYAFKAERPIETKTGFAVSGDFGRLEFLPPCLVTFSPDYPGMPFGGSLVLATYCVPTKPGYVRPLATVLLDKNATLGTTLSERALGIFMSRWTPDWFGHVASSFVLHQDATLLYHQSRNLRDQGLIAPERPGVAYEHLVYAPTSADMGILMFRRWLHKHAGSGVPWACADVLPARGTEDVFDVWHAHTKNCAYCTQAYSNLQTAKHLALLALAAALVFMPQGADRAIVSVLSAATAAALHKFNSLFLRYDFSHADND
ncbi:hypothetical protein CTAYLR_006813 [Chrysophaeum taylorii]|uniref:Rieske domain-containing protein n=1 Tax=Chrysophaeum taylorii TaxID=2483200 RepID=A0AAD7UBC4_9STRA|nr:hypothetical protein CTAYLR_006813 [Chrysophaeum taylorii]